MVKTNIKMWVTQEQSEAVQKIIKAHGAEMVFSNNRVNAISFGGTLAVFNFYDADYGGEYGFALLPFEEVDADLFIRTNGTCEESKGHPHAELMAEYAKDAAETDRPWERWEIRFGSRWHDIDGHPSWLTEEVEYRRKPQRR